MWKKPWKLRILIADDHPLIRQAVLGVLKRQRSWRIVGQAVNGGEAVRMCEDLQPDVALLDIEMPELDGLQAIREIRGRSPRTQVVVLTMHESDLMVRKILEAGARGYVSKSDLLPDIVNAVKAVIRDKLFLAPKVSDIVINAFLKSGGIQAPLAEPSPRLSPREGEVIRLLASGHANKMISAKLGITLRTVETHRAKIMLKLGLHSLTELLHYAIRHGMCDVPTLGE